MYDRDGYQNNYVRERSQMKRVYSACHLYTVLENVN